MQHERLKEALLTTLERYRDRYARADIVCPHLPLDQCPKLEDSDGKARHEWQLKNRAKRKKRPVMDEQQFRSLLVADLDAVMNEISQTMDAIYKGGK